MALSVAAGAFASAVLGMIISVAVPLASIRALKPLIGKVSEWALQTAVGAEMMLVAIKEVPKWMRKSPGKPSSGR